MTGYQEVFTDPSYYGQVLIMNSVHIGNYGVKKDDIESDNVKIRGLIGRNLEEQFSRKQADGSLEEYLKTNNIVCIEGGGYPGPGGACSGERGDELHHFFRNAGYQKSLKRSFWQNALHGRAGTGFRGEYGKRI